MPDSYAWKLPQGNILWGNFVKTFFFFLAKKKKRSGWSVHIKGNSF